MLVFVVWLVWQSKRDRKRFLSRIGDSAEILNGFNVSKEELRAIAMNSYENAIKKKTKML